MSLYLLGYQQAVMTARFVEQSAKCDGFGNPYFQGMNDAGRDLAIQRHVLHMNKYQEWNNPTVFKSHSMMITDFWGLPIRRINGTY